MVRLTTFVTSAAGVVEKRTVGFVSLSDENRPVPRCAPEAPPTQLASDSMRWVPAKAREGDREHARRRRLAHGRPPRQPNPCPTRPTRESLAATVDNLLAAFAGHSELRIIEDGAVETTTVAHRIDVGGVVPNKTSAPLFSDAAGRQSPADRSEPVTWCPRFDEELPDDGHASTASANQVVHHRSSADGAQCPPNG